MTPSYLANSLNSQIKIHVKSPILYYKLCVIKTIKIKINKRLINKIIKTFL